MDFAANVLFGEGSVASAGEVALRYGRTAMVVTCPWPDEQVPQFKRVLRILEDAGIRVVLFNRARSNPTSALIDEAGAIAREERIDMVIGLGGGSAIDTAKGASLCYAHDGGVWQYTYAVDDPYPIFPEKLLPVIAITTTSGTGSHVTPYAVLQNTKLRVKTAVIATKGMMPNVAIVDPEQVVSLPPYQTAVTGFDVFAHAFEAYVDDHSNPFVELLALHAIKIAARNLVSAYKDGTDKQARYNMAIGDTLAGMCITLNNTSMPHLIGQAIIGKRHEITHGQSLAIAYPEFVDCALPFYESEMAKVARLFSPTLKHVNDGEAASALKGILIAWQRELGILTSAAELGVSEEDKEAVLEETLRTCAFLTQKARQSRAQVSAMINRIWYQRF
ncbi:MAG: iron-containing alcohol dehydrogenase [Clostridia bacterium]|nr:iron-containing alcohol dehydrogenase [Clostridia bacterium]